MDDKINKLENKAEIMETILHAMEIKKTPEQGEANTVGNIKLKDRTKQLEEKFNHNLTLNNIEGKIDIKPIKEEMNKLNLTLNNIEGKIDIKPIKEEMNKLIALDHECNKSSLNLIIFCLKEEEEERYVSHCQDITSQQVTN